MSKETMKMARLFLCVVGIAWIWLITSCQPKAQPEALSKAQHLMHTHSDSALFVLEHEVKKEELTNREYALWCLLITKAKDKCYIKHTSDSIINIALNYYKNSEDKELLMEAYYYKGRVHHDMDNALHAQDYYLKALEAGKGSQNYTILSRICHNIGSLYLYQDVYEQAIQYQTKTLRYANKNNDSIAISYALRDIARSFTAQNELDSALNYYEKALAYANDANKINIYSEQGFLYWMKQDYETSYKHLQEAFKLIPKDKKEDYKAVNINFGITYLGLNKPDSAMFHLQSAIQSNDPSIKANANYYLYKFFKQKGDIKKALFHIENSKALLDSLDNENRINALRRMQILHDYHQAETQINTLETTQAKNERDLYRAWVVVLACIFLLMLILSIFAYITKKSNRERKRLQKLLLEQEEDTRASIEENLARIEDLENLIINSKAEIEQIKIENERLNQLQLKQELATDALNSSAIYKKLHLAAHNAKSEQAIDITPEDKEELMSTIEKIYPDFSMQIIQRYPTVSKEELYLCYLLKVGIKSPSVLSFFMHISANSVTMKRNRLYEKLFGEYGDKKLFEKFIDSL